MGWRSKTGKHIMRSQDQFPLRSFPVGGDEPPESPRRLYNQSLAADSLPMAAVMITAAADTASLLVFHAASASESPQAEPILKACGKGFWEIEFVVSQTLVM